MNSNLLKQGETTGSKLRTRSSHHAVDDVVTDRTQQGRISRDIIHGLLYNITYRSRVHALSKLQPLLYGLTQGSVLGPLLFNMYTADISKVVESHGHKLHQYADNCHVYVTVPVSESASAVDHFSHCRRRVKVGELQPPSSQPGEDARRLPAGRNC